MENLKDPRQGSVGRLQQGFTLIELVIVLAVLGALASIAVPQLTGLQDDAELAGTATTVSSELNGAFAGALANNELDQSGNGGVDWTVTSICAEPLSDGSTTLSDSDFGVTGSNNTGGYLQSTSITVPYYESGGVKSKDCLFVDTTSN